MGTWNISSSSLHGIEQHISAHTAAAARIEAAAATITVTITISIYTITTDKHYSVKNYHISVSTVGQCEQILNIPDNKV